MGLQLKVLKYRNIFENFRKLKGCANLFNIVYIVYL